MNFLWIDIEFQRSQQTITNKSLVNYSYVSLTTQKTPWGFSNSNTEALSRVREGRRGLTGRFPARGSPAARGNRSGGFTGSRRTSGCLESRLGWSEMGCRRRAAARGLGARRRGSSGEVWARGSGLGAALGRGGANGGGCRGGAGLQWRLRGGVKLAGVRGERRRRSGAWG